MRAVAHNLLRITTAGTGDKALSVPQTPTPSFVVAGIGFLLCIQSGHRAIPAPDTNQETGSWPCQGVEGIPWGCGRPRPSSTAKQASRKGCLPYLSSIFLDPGQFIRSQGAFSRVLRDHFFPFHNKARVGTNGMEILGSSGWCYTQRM